MESIQPPPISPDAAVAWSIYYEWNNSGISVLRDVGFKQATGVEPNPQGIVEFFGDKIVLDAGSGLEHFAKDVQTACTEAGKDVTVVNLNPQLSARVDSVSDPELIEPGKINERLQTSINIENKYFGGVHGMYPYVTDEKAVPEGAAFLRRNAIAAYLQEAPFADGVFDVIISSWYFPDSLLARKNETSMITAEQSAEVENIALKSIREMTRILAPDGVILLGPSEDNGAFEELFALYPEWRKGRGSISGSEEQDADPLVLIVHKNPGSYELRHASNIEKRQQLIDKDRKAKSLSKTVLSFFSGTKSKKTP
ncbi:MAG: hypothetical protein Q7T41_00245 [Candidatus Saccharibacteria bacterium]|nr:hypothetical protein [Candidatus Saccharibacteria bacterium]